MDAVVAIPPADTKGVFLAFASCGLLVVLMLFLSTLALRDAGSVPLNASADGPWRAKAPTAQVQARILDKKGWVNGTPFGERQVLQPVRRYKSRGRFDLLPPKLYVNTSDQYFCFYQARAERPESAGVLFGLSVFPYHLCTHVVFCCAHLNESSLQIEAPAEAQGFPPYLHGHNPYLRLLLGLTGRMPPAIVSGSDWIFIESAIVWLTPRGYEGAVLVWKAPLATLAARRSYTDFLERMGRRFGREHFTLGVLVDTSDSLKQRLDLGEIDDSLPDVGDGAPVPRILLHPIMGQPPVARSEGVGDERSAVTYEKNRLRTTLTKLHSTLRVETSVVVQDERAFLMHSLYGGEDSGIATSANEASTSKLCYVFSFAAVTYKFWDSNVTGVQELAYGPGDPGPSTKTPGELAYHEICNEVWDSSKVFEFGVVSRQGVNWVSHLSEFVLPSLARFLRDEYGARCFGVWNLWHDDFAGACGRGQYPLMKNLFGLFSDHRQH
ncbi:chitinase-3-like protein 1 [Haemaphysalis longicornis]